jgi:hypothetical protein
VENSVGKQNRGSHLGTLEISWKSEYFAALTLTVTKQKDYAAIGGALWSRREFL